MDDPSTTWYHHRAETGDFKRIAANLKNLKKCALMGVEYARDFERDAKTGFQMKTSDVKKTPFSTWIFGEIAPRAVGTLHQASGNHFIGRPPVCLSCLSQYNSDYSPVQTH